MCPALDLSLPHIFTWHPRKAHVSGKAWSHDQRWAWHSDVTKSATFHSQEAHKCAIVEWKAEMENVFDFCISDLGYYKHGKSNSFNGQKNWLLFLLIIF